MDLRGYRERALLVAEGEEQKRNDSTTYIDDAKDASKEANPGETSPSWCASKGDEGGRSRCAAWNFALGLNFAGGDEEAAIARRGEAPGVARGAEGRRNEREPEKRQFR